MIGFGQAVDLAKTKERSVITRTSSNAGWQDLWGGMASLNLAWWLASEDMNWRYARTALGPLWNVLGTAVLVCSMGLTFGVILQQPLRDFLPYVAASMAIWGAISGLVSESPTVFVRNAGLISAYSLPLSIHVYRMSFDKLTMLVYSLIVYAVLAVVFVRMPTAAILLLPLAFVLYFFFGAGAGLLFGVWGARYRDLNHAVQSLMTLMFLLTPIFWNKTAISSHSWVVEANPLYHLLEIGRGPLLGYYPAMENWIVSGCVAAGLFVLGLFNFAGGRRAVLYWM